MASTSSELRSFYEFLGRKLAEEDGPGPLSPEEALTLWELERQTPEEEAEALEAIREGLEDMDAGRTRPAREALEELRRKYNLPPLP